MLFRSVCLCACVFKWWYILYLDIFSTMLLYSLVYSQSAVHFIHLGFIFTTMWLSTPSILPYLCYRVVSEYAPLRIPIYEAKKDNTATTMLNKIAMLKVFIVYPIVKETAHTLLISRIRKWRGLESLRAQK